MLVNKTMSFFLSTMSVLISTIFLVRYLIMIKKTKSSARTPPLPPGPSPWPVVGSIPEMWRRRPAFRWINRVMEELCADVACFRLGQSYTVVVRSPEVAREFLKRHDAEFASRPETMATRMLSRGYLTTGVGPWGDQWRKMRRILAAEVFNHSNVKWMLHSRNLEADNLVRFIYNQCSNSSNGGLVNVRIAARHYSASVMRRMIFDKRNFGKGREDGGPGPEDEDHVAALGTMLEYVYAFSVSDYLPWLEWLDFDGHRKKVCDALRVIKKYIDRIVDDRIREWRDGIRTIPRDLLDVFISLKDSKRGSILSDEEIRAQVTEVFLTLDNPYNVAEWALSEMLNQPEMLSKAAEELDRVVGKERLLQESDIPNLPYVTAIARETLRLHPVTPFNLPHTSLSDAVVAGHFIPKGSTVLLSRLGLGRNPRVWPDPMRFDPARHLSGEGGRRRVDLTEDELRFVSFGVGRRGCTNVGLGTNLIMMALGRILQAFTWNVPDGTDEVDLTESSHTLFKAVPLLARAKPRLNPSVYVSLF